MYLDEKVDEERGKKEKEINRKWNEYLIEKNQKYEIQIHELLKQKKNTSNNETEVCTPLTSFETETRTSLTDIKNTLWYILEKMKDSETILSSDTTKKGGSIDTRKQRDRQETIFILKKIEKYLDNITKVECHPLRTYTLKDGLVPLKKAK
jgi:hypothetical protein